MPKWTCSRCLRYCAGSERKRKATGEKFWILYTSVDARANENDVLCTSCSLDIQKSSGNLLKRKGYAGPAHASKFFRPSTNQNSIQSESDINLSIQDNPPPAYMMEASTLDSRNGQQQLMNIDETSIDVNHVHIPGILRTKSTQRCCFLCGDAKGRQRISGWALHDAWKKTRIFVSPRNRVCAHHLIDGKFTSDALQQITAFQSGLTSPPEALSAWIHFLTNDINANVRTDFAENSDLTNADYELLIGISKANFQRLMGYATSVKNSTNRSRRNAVAMFLMKLRHNFSNRIIAFIFGVGSEAVVSETITSVANVLEQTFVPSFLGYQHVTRQEVIAHHSVPAFLKLLHHDDDDSVILIMDGTYIYVQRPSDHKLQRLLYSGQKQRHLAKFMTIVTSTGYIIECEGPYGADGGNNDSSILRSMMKRGDESVLGFLAAGDIAILDRGFRDIVSELECNSVSTHMPRLLSKKLKKFSSEEANESRQVTLLRWIVEAVHGRLKNKYHFLDQVVKNTLIPKLRPFLRIACALTNAFSNPIFSASETHSHLIEMALRRITINNDLEVEVNEKRLATRRVVWKKASSTEVTDFPKLELPALHKLTLGVYQLELAAKYTKDHMSGDGTYEIFIYKEDVTLITAKLQSRFCKRQKRKVWVRYTPNGVEAEDVTGWFCDCKTGSRTLGCCSHVAAVIWFLSHGRHHPASVPKSKRFAEFILDAAEQDANASPSASDQSDEDE